MVASRCRARPFRGRRARPAAWRRAVRVLVGSPPRQVAQVARADPEEGDEAFRFLLDLPAGAGDVLLAVAAARPARAGPAARDYGRGHQLLLPVALWRAGRETVVTPAAVAGARPGARGEPLVGPAIDLFASARRGEAGGSRVPVAGRRCAPKRAGDGRRARAAAGSRSTRLARSRILGDLAPCRLPAVAVAGR